MQDLHYVFEVPHRGEGSPQAPTPTRDEATAYLDAGLRQAFRCIIESPRELNRLLGGSLPLKVPTAKDDWAGPVLDTGALSPVQYERLLTYLSGWLFDTVRLAAVWNPVLLQAVRAMANTFSPTYVVGVFRSVPLPTAAASQERNAPQGETPAALQSVLYRAERPTARDIALAKHLGSDEAVLKLAGRVVVNFQKGEPAQGYATLYALQRYLHGKADEPIATAAWLVKDASERLDAIEDLLRPTRVEQQFTKAIRAVGQRLASDALKRAGSIGSANHRILTSLAKSEGFTPPPSDPTWVMLSDIEQFCPGCAKHMRKAGLKAVTFESVRNTLDREMEGWSDATWDAAIAGMRELGVDVPDEQKAEKMLVEEEQLAKAGQVRSKITGKLVSRKKHLAGRAGMSSWARKMKAEGGAHPFTFCFRKMAKHIGEDRAKRFCARVHMGAFGMTPGQRKAHKRAIGKGELVEWQGTGRGEVIVRAGVRFR